MDIRKFSIPEIIFGKGSLQYAGMYARQLGARKILLVSDQGIKQCGWVDKVCDILNREKLDFVPFLDVYSNPRDFQVHEGARLYKRENADVIMALGGGSPIDLAKGVGIIAGNGGMIQDYEGANLIQYPLPPMITIPSTAGSGSDLSQFSIITDVQRRVKMSIISRSLVPNVSIIDPTIPLTADDEFLIASAIDALAHAVESYVSVIAFSMTELHALQAISLILKHLKPAVETRSDKDIEALCAASSEAGISFSNASLGMTHAMAHSLGGVYDVLHGLVHPVFLPAVMRYNQPSCPEKMATIGEIILGKRLSTPRETALAGIAELEAFFETFDIPTRLKAIIPDRNHLRQVCEMAVQDACLLTNPRPASADDMLAICEEVWE